MNMPQFTIDRWLGGKKAAAVLTFDDWTPGHTMVAVPLLNRMGFKGTFFVTLSNFGIRPNEDHWWALQQLQSNGHEIGNHTINHNDLCQLTPTRLFAETTYVKEIIEDHLIGNPLRTFAYPFGKYNSAVINELKKQHIAARSFSDTNENLNFHYDFAMSDEDYFTIAPIRANAQLSEDEFDHLTNQYITHNGLMTCVFHGTFNDSCTNDEFTYDSIHEKKLESLIQVLDNRAEDLWITTFANAVSYHRYVNALEYRISIETEQIIRVDITDNSPVFTDVHISAFIGFHNGKIPVSVIHKGKYLFVDYSENGIRILIDSQWITEPLFIHYQ